MHRYAVVNATGEVVNVIKWDGATKWTPPKGHYIVRAPISDVNDTYDIDNDILMRADRRSSAGQ